MPNEDYVYIVKRNADMTEGRGPMILDSVWSNGSRPECAAYLDAQKGVMGRTEKWSEAKYGDWTMERVTLFNEWQSKEDRELAALREKALQKLTQQEIKALGL